MRTVTFDEKEWKIVPKEPTFLMIEAGNQQIDSDSEEVYAAMLAISPPLDEQKTTKQPKVMKVLERWYNEIGLRASGSLRDYEHDLYDAAHALFKSKPKNGSQAA
jgi:hypothetical protein